MEDNLILNTVEWFAATGQIPYGAGPNARQSGFYIGMQVEELAEKLECVLGVNHHMVKEMHSLGNAFKAGNWDDRVLSALTAGLAKDMLDADMDLLWVSIGAARAQGADVTGAYSAVSDANWDKQETDLSTNVKFFRRDPVTGKVLKRAGWRAPDLNAYVHPGLREPS